MADEKVLYRDRVTGRVAEKIITTGGGSVPTAIDAGQTLLIPANSQVLFSEEIDLAEGSEIEFEENSMLIEVS